MTDDIEQLGFDEAAWRKRYQDFALRMLIAKEETRLARTRAAETGRADLLLEILDVLRGYCRSDYQVEKLENWLREALALQQEYLNADLDVLKHRIKMNEAEAAALREALQDASRILQTECGLADGRIQTALSSEAGKTFVEDLENARRRAVDADADRINALSHNGELWAFIGSKSLDNEARAYIKLLQPKVS